MATITDVAKAAKVSVGTVSNYLNGTARVADGTADRIQSAIDSLGYRVDLRGRVLRAKRTSSIGLLLPNITNPFYAEVARSIEHHLSLAGYQTLLCDAFERTDREDEYLANLMSRRVDGILMIYSHEREVLLNLAKSADIPVVFVDRAVAGQASVHSDNRLGGRLAAQHLLELGHRRIGVLAGEPEVRNVQERVAGFREELERHGVPLPAPLVLQGEQKLSFGYRIAELLEKSDPPSAIFATNDIVAVGAWRRLVELGFRVPEDLSLIGFDDIEMSRLTVPALTTVAQDKQALGQRAAALLLDSIQGKTPRPSNALLTIPTRLEKRGSTARVRGGESSSRRRNEVSDMTG